MLKQFDTFNIINDVWTAIDCMSKSPLLVPYSTVSWQYWWLSISSVAGHIASCFATLLFGFLLMETGIKRQTKYTKYARDFEKNKITSQDSVVLDRNSLSTIT